MSNPCHSDLLDAIRELQRQYPSWRLGQLVANVAGWADESIWDIEDDQLLAAAHAHLRQTAASAAAAASSTDTR